MGRGSKTFDKNQSNFVNFSQIGQKFNSQKRVAFRGNFRGEGDSLKPSSLGLLYCEAVIFVFAVVFNVVISVVDATICEHLSNKLCILCN